MIFLPSIAPRTALEPQQLAAAAVSRGYAGTASTTNNFHSSPKRSRKEAGTNRRLFGSNGPKPARLELNNTHHMASDASGKAVCYIAPEVGSRSPTCPVATLGH